MNQDVSQDAGDRTERAHVRRGGRAWIVAFHAASRAVKLYPIEHQAVQRAVSDLAVAARELCDAEGEFTCHLQGEFLFINGIRLRLDATNYASFGSVLRLLRDAEVGKLTVTRDATTQDWLVLVASLGPGGTGVPPGSRLQALMAALAAAGVTAFDVTPPLDSNGDVDNLGDTPAEVHEAAKRTYAQSVAISKDVINSVRMGRAPSLRRLKRAVQGIVDQVLTEETSLIGLTTLRDYDEYTYTHSVNVCIFAVALGKRMGMTKPQLYELGLAALLHDIGKVRVPPDVLQKAGTLDEQDWRQLMAHPWFGLLMLSQMRGGRELPYHAMLVAYEHHMKCDLTGYPRTRRPRTLGILTRIVSVADGYDAATTRRVYQTVPYPPSAVLQEMRDNPLRGMDPVVVKAFINLLGIYPVGTLVVLDTFELAVVRSANPEPEFLSRPIVTIVSDAQGNLLVPPPIVDLGTRSADGQFARTIIKTADPDRYGIRVSDYLV